MKKIKNNKGITLIALIITIILLLILAIVTISAVNEGNLFAHANNAARTYSERAEEENTLLSNYVSYIEEYSNKSKSENQNKWAERGITNVQIGEDKKYYCADTGNGTSYCIYLTENGDIYAGTNVDGEFLQWESAIIDTDCTFSTSNRMEEGSEYYIFNGESIEIHFNGPSRTFTATLQDTQ